MLTAVLVDGFGRSGLYFDESGEPMQGAALVHDLAFQDRVVAQTRAFLAAMPA